MIDSVYPLEEMKNQVTLGFYIKYVLIKLCEDVENEAVSTLLSVRQLGNFWTRQPRRRE